MRRRPCPRSLLAGGLLFRRTVVLVFVSLFPLAVAAEQPGGNPVWFQELALAAPLDSTASAGLAHYLLALTRNPRSPKARLDAALLADREPRMAFVSLGSDTGQARVLRASGRGAAQMARELQRQLRNETEPAKRNGLVRVDLVTTVLPEQAVDRQHLQHPRSLYGLAFDRETGLAYLADQVVAATVIDSEQRLRLQSLSRLGRVPEAKVERLRRQTQLDLYRFATEAHLWDGTAVLRLVRGHREFRSLEPDLLLHHARLAGQYLNRAVGPEGRFDYAYLPKSDELRSSYNVLRHCGTLFSMLELYAETGDENLLAAAERAIDYLKRNFVRQCEVGGSSTPCVLEDGHVKLGGNALAIIALAKHWEVSEDRQHWPLIDGLGEWILRTQDENGQFTIHKQAQPSGEVSDFVSSYYPGEALLALVRRPEAHPRWLDAAQRGAHWLIRVRDRGLPLERLEHDHWLLYALRDLHELRPDPIYLEHALRISTAILDRQRRSNPEQADWLGSYYTPPRSTPTATRSEGLAAAYQLFMAAGRIRNARPLLAALELGVGFQLQLQFLGETSLYLPNPQRSLGGFRRSFDNYEVRIDYVQHNLSSLLLLREILRHAAPERPGPAKP